MGEAKRRNQVPMVYHHTSTLRTNLLWMSGVIEVEGQGEDAIHPQLGVVGHGASLRRSMNDFPPLAWFTKRLDVPKCLQTTQIVFSKPDGTKQEFDLEGNYSNAITLNRIALGFKLEDVSLVHWPEHPGYHTSEGQELNESAREFGDDPADWYVSETPVDLMILHEAWGSRRRFNVKLERLSGYVDDIKKMVMQCRGPQKAFIPPAWLTEREAIALGQKLGLKMVDIFGGAPALGKGDAT